MALRVREGKTDQQRVARMARGVAALGRRTLRVGALLALAVFAMFAVTTVPSGAATGSTAKPAATTPSVSSVTVTVPGATPPPPVVSAPTDTTPPVTASPPTVTTPPPPVVPPSTGQPAAKPPSAAAPAAPGVQARSGSAPSVSSSASGADRRFAATRASRRRNHDASVQQQLLRSTVVRLSQCFTTLSADNQRILLLRAGIDMAQPDSRGVVARAFHISVAHEASVEHAAVLQLQTADRQGACGSPPVWIHVPAENRLVPVAAVLINSAQPARGSALGG
jgi:hypothetical protein